MKEIVEVLDIMDKVGIVWGFVLIIITIINFTYNLYYRRNKEKEITIFIEFDGKKQELPHKIIRRNFTRSEIFGILGALDSDSKFNIKYTASSAFFNDILLVQKGKKDEIIIKLENNDKFDWEHIKNEIH